MDIRNRQWILSLVNEFLRGAWGGLGAGGASTIIDPEHFNLMSGGLTHVLAMSAIAWGVTGLIHAASYLARKPLPPSLSDELPADEKDTSSSSSASSPPSSAPPSA